METFVSRAAAVIGYSWHNFFFHDRNLFSFIWEKIISQKLNDEKYRFDNPAEDSSANS